MEESATFKTGIKYQVEDNEEKEGPLMAQNNSQLSNVDFFIRSSVSPANPIRLLDANNASVDEKRASIYAYLDKNFREHTARLITSLNTFMAQIISGLFQELRTDIQNRKLYVLFEQALGCDPVTDHLAAKDVLPIYEPFIEKAEKTFRILTLHKFKHEIEIEFCSAIIAELQARLKIENNNLHIATELEQMRMQNKVLSDESTRMTKQWQQEREKLIQQINTLSEQVVQRKRVGNVYKPDFLEAGSNWDVDVTIPDFKNAPSKNVKEILELETKLAQDAKERDKMQMELDASLMKCTHFMEECKKIPELQGQVDQLQQEIEKLLKELMEKNDVIANQQVQIDDLMDQLQALQRSYDKLEKDYLSYQDTIDSLTAARNEDQNEKEHLRKQLSDFLKRVTATEAERDKYKQQVIKGDADRSVSLVNINEHTVKSARLPGSGGSIDDTMKDALLTKQFLYELTGFNLLTPYDGFTEDLVLRSVTSQDDEPRVQFSISVTGGAAKPILPGSAPRGSSRATSRKNTPRHTLVTDDTTSPKTLFMDRQPSIGSTDAAIIAASIPITKFSRGATPKSTSRSASAKRLLKNVAETTKTTPDLNEKGTSQTVTPSRGIAYEFKMGNINPAYFNPGVQNPYDNIVSSFYRNKNLPLSELSEKIGVDKEHMRTIRDIIGRFFSGDHAFMDFLRLLAEGAIEPKFLSKLVSGLQTGELKVLLDECSKADQDGNPIYKENIYGDGIQPSSEGRKFKLGAMSSEPFNRFAHFGASERTTNETNTKSGFIQRGSGELNAGKAGGSVTDDSKNYGGLSAKAQSSGGIETLPNGTILYWKQTQTILQMTDLDELLTFQETLLNKGINTDNSKRRKNTELSSTSRSVSKSHLYESDGHTSKDDTSADISSARGIPPDILKNTQVSKYLDERLQIEREKMRDEVVAEKDLESIEQIRMAVEAAETAMDFWCQVNCDDSESNESGFNKGDMVAEKIQNAIGRVERPGFKIKYNRTPKDWTVKGVFERLYRNAEEIRARLNMKRAEYQKKEALLYAKYLRSQNSILPDEALLVSAIEYDTISELYAQEAQKWDAKANSFAQGALKLDENNKLSRAFNSNPKQSNDALRKSGKMSTADLIEEANQYTYKDHLIRITSSTTRSPDMEDILASTSSIRTAPRNVLEKVRERVTTVFDIESSSIRGTPRSSMAGSMYRNINNTPRESISGSYDTNVMPTPIHSKSLGLTGERRPKGTTLMIKDHSVHHSIKQQSPGQASYSAELVTMSISDGYTGARGSKPVLVSSSTANNPLPYLSKKGGFELLASTTPIDGTCKKDLDSQLRDSDPSDIGIPPMKPDIEGNLHTINSSTALPQLHKHADQAHSGINKSKKQEGGKLVYDQYGKLMPAQEIQDIIAYKYIFGNSSALKVKDMGQRLLISVPDSTHLIEVSKETLRKIKENVDKLIEFFKVPGISNMYGNDLVGRTASAKRNASAKRYSQYNKTQGELPYDNELDVPAVSIERDTTPTASGLDQKEKIEQSHVFYDDDSDENVNNEHKKETVPAHAAILTNFKDKGSQNSNLDVAQVLGASVTPQFEKNNLNAAHPVVRNGNDDSDFITPPMVASSVIKQDRYGFETMLETAVSKELREKMEPLEEQVLPLQPNFSKVAKKHEVSVFDLEPSSRILKDPYAEKLNHLDEEGSITPSSMKYGLSVVEVKPNTDFQRPREDNIVLNSFLRQSDNSLQNKRLSNAASAICIEKESEVFVYEPSDLSDKPKSPRSERNVMQYSSSISSLDDKIKAVDQSQRSTTNMTTPTMDPLIEPREASQFREQSEIQPQISASGNANQKSIIRGIESVQVSASTPRRSISTSNTPQQQGVLSLDDKVSLRIVGQDHLVKKDDPPLSQCQEFAPMPSYESNQTDCEMILQDHVLDTIRQTNNDIPEANHTGYEHFKLPSYNPQDSNFVAASLHIKGKRGTAHQINNFIHCNEQTPNANMQNSNSCSRIDDEIRKSLENGNIKIVPISKATGDEHHVSLSRGIPSGSFGLLPNNYMPGKCLPQEPFIKSSTGPIDTKGLLANASDALLVGRQSMELSSIKGSSSSNKQGQDSENSNQSSVFAQSRLYMSRLHIDLQKAREADGSSLIGKKTEKP